MSGFPLRPLADAMPDGRTAVYVAGSTAYLPRDAVVRLFAQLGRALGIPCDEDDAVGYRRFALWVATLRNLPSNKQVMEHCEISRATAYRWIARAAEARGTDKP